VHAGDDTFPSVWQAALLLLANFLLQYLIGALLYDLRRPMDLAQSHVQALVMVLANGIVLMSVLHVRRMTYRELLHPSRSSVPATLMVLVPPVLLLVPLVMLLDHALMAVVHQLFPLSVWEEQAFAGMVAGNIASVIATCVLAPILEEMLFRGVLLRAFLTQYPRCRNLLLGAAVRRRAPQRVPVLARVLARIAAGLAVRAIALADPVHRTACRGQHHGRRARAHQGSEGRVDAGRSGCGQLAAGTGCGNGRYHRAAPGARCSGAQGCRCKLTVSTFVPSDTPSTMELGYTIVYVPDVAASLQFFELAFGVKRRFLHESGTCGELDTGETTLSFAAIALGDANFHGRQVEAHASAKPLGTEIALVTADVARDHPQALARGARELGAPATKPWGPVVPYVRALDGCLTELCTPVAG